ncbi:hypothetical protein ACFFX0_28640 [Citricoccus parietis]|uniref:Uncharacterized protein n=1 Tax=Citricoccus parietis TaxID=592307 RepID=A0ABV5G7M9_9MICC
MQLHGGARGLRGDVPGVVGQVLGPVDVDEDVLAAGLKDRRVQRRVAVALADPVLAGQVLPVQGGQDSDGVQLRPGTDGTLVRPVQFRLQGFLEIAQSALTDGQGRVVELDVVPAQFRLERRIVDGVQDLAIQRRRLGRLIHQVQFQLQADPPRSGEVAAGKVVLQLPQ